MEQALEKIASAPAKVLDKSVDASLQFVDTTKKTLKIEKAKEFWHILGPGLSTGAADDDPSGIGTYSQTGAQYGFKFLWLSFVAFPLMAFIQEMCARIGMVTGEGLAANIKRHFPRPVLYLCASLLIIANTLNIGADLGAMAKSFQLMVPSANFAVLVVFFATLSLGLQIFVSYKRYSKYLKYLALVLIAYIFSALSLELDWKYILSQAVIPSISFSKDQLIILTAVLGTTISPYLFFWQTSQEVEQEIVRGNTTLESRIGTEKSKINHMRIDIWSGMTLSGIAMFFIITTCAAVLFTNGITNITTAADAAKALRPFAGDQAYLLFALGIIGTGMLAVPVLAGSASYAISEAFGWDNGLNRTLKEASAFYGVIIISVIIGLIMNFVGLDPIKSLIYSAVVNGLVAPVILVLIVLMSSSKKIMGQWKNHKVISGIGWLVTIIMTLSGIGTILSLIS